MFAGLKSLAVHHCFGGEVHFCTHQSRVTATEMRFGIFLPPQATEGMVPALYYLAGLTCNEETFLVKAGALRFAAQLGLALIAPDTSPRDAGIPGEDADWSFGLAASFYLDATCEPWARNYKMFSYVTAELPTLIETHFPVANSKRGIFGHSMGGHGALTIALKQPERWQSVSAFAPICNPAAVPWGQKAFESYLGPNQDEWAKYDASLLMGRRPYPSTILVDQGLSDKFLHDQLRPHMLEQAAEKVGQSILLRQHDGYDHSYWFIQSFIEEHLRWHAERLCSF